MRYAKEAVSSCHRAPFHFSTLYALIAALSAMACGGESSSGQPSADGDDLDRDPKPAPEACNLTPHDLALTPFSSANGAANVPTKFTYWAGCGGMSIPAAPCGEDGTMKVEDLQPEPDTYAGCSALHIAGAELPTFAMLQVRTNFPYDSPVGPPSALNAVGYTGLKFWARGLGSMFVGVPTPETAGDYDGGRCVSDPGDNFGACGDSFGNRQQLSTAWKEYRLPFSSMRQAGWGQRAAQTHVDVTQVLGVNFVLDHPLTFDFRVTGIAFYKD